MIEEIQEVDESEITETDSEWGKYTDNGHVSNTLYKKNSSGKIMEWKIIVEGDQYWAEYGQQGGSMQSDTPTTCKSKNIGRANETTPEEQALSEAQAKYTKQIDMKNYVEDIKDVDKFVFKPTLAHTFDKHGHKLPNDILVSQKLDGLRCYITKNGAFSRNGKRWVATKYIEDSLKGFFEKNPDVILDGEIYSHTYADDFNKIVSLAKKMKNIKDEEWDEIKEKLEFHIFDIFHPNNVGSLKRYMLLKKIFGKEREHNYHNIVVVPSYMTTKDKFMEYYEKFMADGYEGIMLRDPDAKYEHKRSYGLQKYKQFRDAEFEIVDIIEGTGNRSGMFGRAVLKNKNGKTFEANARGDTSYYKELLKNKHKYIGKMATVRYQNETPDEDGKGGVPRFGVMIAIRDYE